MNQQNPSFYFVKKENKIDACHESSSSYRMGPRRTRPLLHAAPGLDDCCPGRLCAWLHAHPTGRSCGKTIASGLCTTPACQLGYGGHAACHQSDRGRSRSRSIDVHVEHTRHETTRLDPTGEESGATEMMLQENGGRSGGGRAQMQQKAAWLPVLLPALLVPQLSGRTVPKTFALPLRGGACTSWE